MKILAWIIGFIPGILWLWFVYKKDKFEPEPLGLVMAIFAAGALSTIPVSIIELAFTGQAGLESAANLSDASRESWIITGFVEESVKFAIVMLLVWKRKGFDEPMDGIVYAAAVSLGFASAENAILISRFGAQALILRGALSTAGHMLFSSIWGYAIGRARFDREARLSLMAKGFVLAVFFHGLYDFLIFTRIFASLVLYVLSILLWNIFTKMVDDARSRSPFAPNSKKLNG